MSDRLFLWGSMRILHSVLSPDFFGSERYCMELAAAQARAGHRVGVLIQDGSSSCARAFRREIDAANTGIASDQTTGSVQLYVIPRGTPSFLHRPFARWILRKFAPEIVHTHLNPAARRVGRVAQRLRVPHVATLHIRYEPPEYGACDGLICDGYWQRTTIPPDFSGELAVVWPWLPITVHDALGRVAPVEIEALRSEWVADDRTVVFGSIGRLTPEKGMDVLIRAFRGAFAQGDEPVRLVIVGAGPQLIELQQLAGSDRRIVLMGTQPGVAPLYRAFDVYVSAARFEPFGLTILEAMDAGCRMVLTRTEGPREFVKDARVHWAQADDDHALAIQLRDAIECGRIRQEYELAPFRLEHAEAAIEGFYEKVLARKQIGSGAI